MRATVISTVVLAATFASDWTASIGTLQPDSEVMPIVEVTARTMKRDGAVAQVSSGTAPFVLGQAASLYLMAGSSHPEEMTVCGGGFAETGSLGDLLKRTSFVWQISVLPTHYENGRETFELEWGRYRADHSERADADGKLTLTLAEGERRAIDFARGATGTGNCNSEATLIEIGARMKENPKLANTILQYDLWLTHRGRDGGQQTRHFVAMGLQGADVSFAFVPLRFAVPEVVLNQLPYDLVTTVLGTVRGRLKPDGRIALNVETTRRDGLGLHGDPPIGWGGSTGTKILDLARGEAIEIEIPVGSGRSSRHATAGVTSAPPRRLPSAPTEPVSISDGWLTVEDGVFFQGTRTSVVVQARPIG
jgi:hypothetical protein